MSIRMCQRRQTTCVGSLTLCKVPGNSLRAEFLIKLHTASLLESLWLTGPCSRSQMTRGLYGGDSCCLYSNHRRDLAFSPARSSAFGVDRRLSAEMDTPLSTQAPVCKSPSCGIDITYIRRVSKGFKGLHNLWSLIRQVSQLGLGKKRVEHSKICVPKLANVSGGNAGQKA